MDKELELKLDHAIAVLQAAHDRLLVAKTGVALGMAYSAHKITRETCADIQAALADVESAALITKSIADQKQLCGKVINFKEAEKP